MDAARQAQADLAAAELPNPATAAALRAWLTSRAPCPARATPSKGDGSIWRSNLTTGDLGTIGKPAFRRSFRRDLYGHLVGLAIELLP